MSSRRVVMATFVPILLLVLVPSAVYAPSTSTPFTTSATFTSLGTPERFWVDEDGVQHGRGQPDSGTLSGDISGTFSIVNNWNIDSAGNGDLFGSFTITVAQGAFEGRYSGTVSGGLSSGTFVGQAGGESKMMGTFGVTGVLEGIILSPHM